MVCTSAREPGRGRDWQRARLLSQATAVICNPVAKKNQTDASGQHMSQMLCSSGTNNALTVGCLRRQRSHTSHRIPAMCSMMTAAMLSALSVVKGTAGRRLGRRRSAIRPTEAAAASAPAASSFAAFCRRCCILQAPALRAALSLCIILLVHNIVMSVNCAGDRRCDARGRA